MFFFTPADRRRARLDGAVICYGVFSRRLVQGAVKKLESSAQSGQVHNPSGFPLGLPTRQVPLAYVGVRKASIETCPSSRPGVKSISDVTDSGVAYTTGPLK